MLPVKHIRCMHWATQILLSHQCLNCYYATDLGILQGIGFILIVTQV